MLPRWIVVFAAATVAAADDGSVRGACEALAAQARAATAVDGGITVPCGLNDAPRWVALNNLGLAHWTLGNAAAAGAYLARAARLAPLEPVPGHNRLWAAAAANAAPDAELTAEVVELGRRLEAAQVAAALLQFGGADPGTSLELHDGATVAFSEAGGSAAVAAAPRWAAAEAEPGDAAPWAAAGAPAAHALAAADLGLGRALCDFPGMGTSARSPGAVAGVDVVKRWVTGYLEGGGDAPFDIGYETVGGGGAAAWDEPGKRRVLAFAHVGSLNLLDAAVADAVGRGVRGDVAECGVFRGGTAAVAASALDAADPGGERAVLAADTFEGIPPPRGGADADAHTDAWPPNSYAASPESVARVFRALGVADRLELVKGPFADALPGVDRALAVLRLDADTYEGTRDALAHLYDALEPGGYVIVDDYHLGGCRRAVREFRAARRLDARAPLLPAPIDYVLGCPRLTATRARILANDVLTGAAAIRKTPMRVAQNVYWRKPAES